MDPEEIIWENLALPLWSKLLRVCCTTALTIFILAISYIMIYEASYLRTKVDYRNLIFILVLVRFFPTLIIIFYYIFFTFFIYISYFSSAYLDFSYFNSLVFIFVLFSVIRRIISSYIQFFSYQISYKLQSERILNIFKNL